jgi:hypothetical protein
MCAIKWVGSCQISKVQQPGVIVSFTALQEGGEHASAEERFAALRARLAARKQEDAEIARLKRRKARIEKKERGRAAEGAAGAIVTLASEAVGPGSDLDASEGSEDEVVDANHRNSSTDVDHAKHKRQRVLVEGLELGGAYASTGWAGDLEAQEARAKQLLAARGL